MFRLLFYGVVGLLLTKPTKRQTQLSRVSQRT
jgi:hypothetical protein